MKISFWIPAVVLSVVRVAFSNSVQVGTVLFTTTDLVKKCWTENDKSLLKARLVMQDVLPDPDCIDFSNPNAVAVLLDYFHSCFQIISTNTYGRIQNLMYLALSDALGGYLRAYVLPFIRRAYYAGEVEYPEAKKLFQLYDDIRAFLKTTGIGWVEPQQICLRHLHVRPLVVTGGALEACKDLYLIEKEGKLHSMDHHPKMTPKADAECKKKKKFKRSSKVFLNREKREKIEDYNFCNSTKNYTGSEPLLGCLAKEIAKNETSCGCNVSAEIGCDDSGTLKRVIVPLPVLDDCRNPHSIAIPFKKRPLMSLVSGDSAFILEYYYLSVIRCFIAKGNTRADIMNFNAQFHTWLVSQVTPHLCEEQWYPGFGGVLRILQTIKKFGVDKSVKDSAFQDVGFLFSEGSEFEVKDEPQIKGKSRVRDVAMSIMQSTNINRHVIIATIIVSLFWLFVFCAVVFCYQAVKGQPSCQKPGCKRQSRDVDCRNVVFQFLVKFFQRRDDCCAPKKKYVCELCTHSREACPSRCKKKNEHVNFFSTFTASPMKKAKDGGSWWWNRGQGDQLQMLWKKPSVVKNAARVEGLGERVRKKRFGSTIGRRQGTSSITSRCLEEKLKHTWTSSSRESCLITQTTSSSSSGETKTSTTMEYFEEVMARRKKRSTEYSTDETESECSTNVTEYRKLSK